MSRHIYPSCIQWRNCPLPWLALRWSVPCCSSALPAVQLKHRSFEKCISPDLHPNRTIVCIVSSYFLAQNQQHFQAIIRNHLSVELYSFFGIAVGLCTFFSCIAMFTFTKAVLGCHVPSWIKLKEHCSLVMFYSIPKWKTMPKLTLPQTKKNGPWQWLGFRHSRTFRVI